MKFDYGSNSDCAKGDNWNDLLKEVVTFDSVEEFWGVYVSLQLGSHYHLSIRHSLTSFLLYTEQHYSHLRACPEVRLPSFQERYPSRVGGPSE